MAKKRDDLIAGFDDFLEKVYEWFITSTEAVCKPCPYIGEWKAKQSEVRWEETFISYINFLDSQRIIVIIGL